MDTLFFSPKTNAPTGIEIFYAEEIPLFRSL